MTTAQPTNQPKLDRLDSIIPEKTPLYVGPDVVINGDINFQTSDPDQRLMIRGEVKGNIYTNGILQVSEGAVINAAKRIECAEIVVAGTIKGEGVTIKANLLMLLPSGNIAVETLCLPPGGLEQSRGGILNARLDMNSEHGTLPALKPADSPAAVVAASIAGAGAVARPESSPLASVTSSSLRPGASAVSLVSNQASKDAGKDTKDAAVVAVAPLAGGSTFASSYPGGAKTAPLQLPGDQSANA
ncbi:polymer-forming cytoskeletal protein [Polaromonas sp.]|uniref:bactofilin family protein n=1 Tax=Polaromonas sp. TaxID=1869339 RepID=UPI00352AD4E6